MTTTLLRHEFLRTRGMLGLIAGITTVLVALGSLLGAYTVAPLDILGVLLAVAVVFGLLPLVMLALAVDYWRSAYGRTGYFTHSLPIKGSRIYAVRLLYGTLVMLAFSVLSLVLAVGPALVSASKQAPQGVGAAHYLATTVRELGSALTPMTWVLVTVAVMAMAWTYLVQYYFAATIGSGRRLGALGPAGPIIAWFLLYLATQVLVFVSIVAVPFGVTIAGGAAHVVGFDFAGEMMRGGSADVMPLGFLPMLLALTALLMWWTAHSWNTRVDLR